MRWTVFRPLYRGHRTQKQMNELELRIQKLLTKCRALRTVMNDNHDHLIPRTFSFSIPRPAHCLTKTLGPPHLDLGAVCQKWRQSAWATPQVWSLLLLGFCYRGQHNYLNGSDLFQLIAEWPERSGGLPITFDRAGEHEDGVYFEVINVHRK